MPVMKRITIAQVESARLFDPGTLLSDDDLPLVKDLWISRSGRAYYAGYYGHDESARLLGYATIEACEIAGYCHISSCFDGNPDIINNAPLRYTKAQLDTISYYFAIHGLKNPLD